MKEALSIASERKHARRPKGNSRVENTTNKKSKNAKEDSQGREELEEGGRM
jgi:hypothetical protein